MALLTIVAALLASLSMPVQAMDSVTDGSKNQVNKLSPGKGDLESTMYKNDIDKSNNSPLLAERQRQLKPAWARDSELHLAPAPDMGVGEVS